MKNRLIVKIVAGLACALLLGLVLPAVAQPSAGGTPPSFTRIPSGIAKQKASDVVSLAAPDVKALLDEDAKKFTMDAGLQPARFGIIIPNVNIDMKNNGSWTTLSATERVWRVSIEAPGAKQLALYYRAFYLPKGAKLYIYNADHSQVLGSYDHTTNPSGGLFATEAVRGDYLTMEYVAPVQPVAGDEPRIEIEKVGYIYKLPGGKGSDISRAGYNTYEFSCLENINCLDGIEWQDEKKGVVKFVFPMGSTMYSGTGCVVNNTGNTPGNFKPYILTAYHNFMNCTDDEVAQVVVHFDYETRGCEMDAEEPSSKTLVGARRLGWNNIAGGSDGCLIELNSKIPASWKIFYNGWDASKNFPNDTLVGIHHPNFDVKKISFFEKPQVSLWFPSESDRPAGDSAHFTVITVRTPRTNQLSHIYGGSSGSPIYKRVWKDGKLHKYIIGTLTGGSGSTCSSIQAIAWYGRLWAHWDHFITATNGNTPLKKFLDPGNTLANTDVKQCEGAYEITPADYTADFMAMKREITVTRSIAFTNTSKYPNGQEPDYFWEFEKGSPSTSTDKNPTVTYNEDGIFNVTLTLKNNGATLATTSRDSFITVNYYTDYCPDTVTTSNPNMYNGTGIFPMGIHNYQSMSAAIYTADELKKNGIARSDRESWIYQVGWEAKGGVNKQRTGRIYLANIDESSFAAAGDTAQSLINYALAHGNLGVDQGGIFHINGTTFFELKQPFKYDPTKNLLVVAWMYLSPNETTIDPKTPYSEKTDMHQWWYLDPSNASMETTVGTVDNKRPILNLVFASDCSASPTGTIQIYPPELAPVFMETFDNSDNLPEGWVNNNPTLYHTWKPSKNRNQYMMNSRWALESQMDTRVDIPSPARITSKEITLPDEDCYLLFYLGSNGENLNSIQLNTYVEVDGRLDLIDSTYRYSYWGGFRFTDRYGDLSHYKGKTIKLIFESKPFKSFVAPAIYIDEVGIFKKNYPSPSSITINEGDTLQFLAGNVTGSPIDYRWKIPGLIDKDTLVGKQLTVIFPKAGEYDVQLSLSNAHNVSNPFVTSLQKAVKVVARAPQAAYKAQSSGYSLRVSDSLQRIFIPAGRLAALTDASKNYPQTFQWTLPGAYVPNRNTLKTSSTGSYYYLNEGVFGMTFEVSNTHTSIPETLRSSSITIDDFAHVSSNIAKHIWNIPAGDGGNAKLTQKEPSGNIVHYTGNDIDPSLFRGLSERFMAPPTPGQITEVGFVADVLSYNDPNATITCKIYPEIITSAGSSLGNLLAEVQIPLSDIMPNGEVTYVQFPEPARVSTPFLVMFMFDDRTKANIVFRSSQKKIPARWWQSGIQGSAYIGLADLSLEEKNNMEPYSSIGWAAYSDLWGWGLSLNVSVKFQYGSLEIDKTLLKKASVDNDPQTVNVTTNNTFWQATSGDKWIILENASNSTSGSFSIRCSENKGYMRQGSVSVSGAGATKTIYVQQAGGPPVNLTAALNSDKSAVDLVWEAQDALKASDIFETFESGMENFERHPAGKYGWSYIDGDGAETFSVPSSTASYPNKGVAKAFMHFNPRQTSPITVASAVQAYQGNSYLVSFASLGKANDDWFISPQLHFRDAFRFEFYAKSMSSDYSKERFNIYYSTTGTAKEDFKKAVLNKAYEEVGTTWTKYAYAIPAEAKYVAIHCVSENGSALMIDNVFIGHGPTPVEEMDANQPVSAMFDNHVHIMKSTNTATDEKIEEETVKPISVSGPADAATSQSTANSGSISKQAIEEKKLAWGNNIPAKGIGWPEGGFITLGIRFTPVELSKYDQHRIVACEYMLHQHGLRELYILIWSGGQLIYKDAIPDANKIPYKTPQRITLKEPIDIDISKELVIGLCAYQEVASGPLSFDTTGYRTGYSDLYINLANGGYKVPGDNPTWSTYGNHAAWNFSGILEGETPGYSYNIYRNNTKLATTKELKYTDSRKRLVRKNVYTVTMVYDDPKLESGPSNEAIVIDRLPITIKADNKVRLKGEENPPFTFSFNGEFAEGDNAEKFRAKIQPQGTTSATRNSLPGSYPIKVTYTEDANYEVLTEDGVLKVEEIIPTAITPGSGDDNAYFLPGVPVQIFNRNGSLIKESDNGWDGTNKNGAVVEAGVYYYYAKFASGTRKGSIEVIKR